MRVGVGHEFIGLFCGGVKADGPVNRILDRLGAGPANLIGTPYTLNLGLVYSFLPFMILAVYLAVERLDDSLVEAANDLYSGPARTFARIVVPGTAGGIAAGCQLVAACDLAVAVDRARFAVSGVNLGLFCATPGVALSRNVPRKQAFEMLVTGEFISAEEARQRGLVNRVVPAEALDAEVARLVDSILAKPRTAIAMGKALFYRQLEMGQEAAYQSAVQTMACNMMDDSALEGVQAFIDKRPPAWARPD